MTQTVTVTRVLSRRYVEVTMRRSSACAHDCKDCAGCPAPQEWVTATAYNLAGASGGDRVVVESRSGAVIGLAAVTYLLPILLFFIGYGAGTALGRPALTGVLAFVAGLALLIPVDKALKRGQKVFFTVISVERKDSNI